MPDFTTIDTARLFAIAERLISVETVQDIETFRLKVQEAATIVTEAALRILGYQSRAILRDSTRAAVARAIELYQQEAQSED